MNKIMLTLVTICFLSCGSFSEYYSVKKPLNSTDKICIIPTGNINKELISILTIDLQRHGINTSTIVSDTFIDFFDDNFIEKTNPITNPIIPLSPTVNKNIFATEALGKENIKNKYENLTKNFTDYTNFIKSLYKSSGITHYIHIQNFTRIRGLSPYKGYEISLITYNEEDNSIIEQAHYIVTGLSGTAWRENFKVVYDRDIREGTLYENDLFIPYSKSVKRHYEFSRRIVDLLTGIVQ